MRPFWFNIGDEDELELILLNEGEEFKDADADDSDAGITKRVRPERTVCTGNISDNLCDVIADKLRSR